MEISVRTSSEAVEAVANAFYEVGAGGVVIEEPFFSETDISGDWNGMVIPETDLQEDERIIKSYLMADEQLTAKVEEIRLTVEQLAQYDLKKGAGTIEIKSVAEEDWANAWKAYYKPTRVGHKMMIKPTWEKIEASKDDIVIELDPGMAFGTGTHPSTMMCLELLEDYTRGGETVFDIGTGSGILAIAAAKLGAKEVKASDIDPLAVHVAQSNIALNGLEEEILVHEGALDSFFGREAQVVVANIISQVILSFIPDLKKVVPKDGIFIASGIILDYLPEIEKSLAINGFKLIKMKSVKEWVGLVAQRMD